MSKNLKETNSSLILAKKSETDSSQDNTENINYIECEYDQDNNFTSKQSDNVKLGKHQLFILDYILITLFLFIYIVLFVMLLLLFKLF